MGGDKGEMLHHEEEDIMVVTPFLLQFRESVEDSGPTGLGTVTFTKVRNESSDTDFASSISLGTRTHTRGREDMDVDPERHSGELCTPSVPDAVWAIPLL